MLFRKDVEHCCSWCRSGTRISQTEVACLRRGIVSAGGSCGRFKYDPLKREPPVPAPVDPDRFTQEDFSLEP